VRVCTSIPEAVAEIEHFYSNYESFAVDDRRGTIKVKRTPTDAQLAALATVVPRFAEGRGYVVQDDHTITFNFDGRNYVNLRRLIDQINGWAG
jgi:hypothetical protein